MEINCLNFEHYQIKFWTESNQVKGGANPGDRTHTQKTPRSWQGPKSCPEVSNHPQLQEGTGIPPPCGSATESRSEQSPTATRRHWYPPSMWIRHWVQKWAITHSYRKALVSPSPCGSATDSRSEQSPTATGRHWYPPSMWIRHWVQKWAITHSYRKALVSPSMWIRHWVQKWAITHSYRKTLVSPLHVDPPLSPEVSNHP